MLFCQNLTASLRQTFADYHQALLGLSQIAYPFSDATATKPPLVPLCLLALVEPKSIIMSQIHLCTLLISLQQLKLSHRALLVLMQL